MRKPKQKAGIKFQNAKTIILEKPIMFGFLFFALFFCGYQMVRKILFFVLSYYYAFRFDMPVLELWDFVVQKFGVGVLMGSLASLEFLLFGVLFWLFFGSIKHHLKEGFE